MKAPLPAFDEGKYPRLSHVHQVAALQPGESHWQCKEVAGDAEMQHDVKTQIDAVKRSLASAATKTIQRVTDKHPRRKYQTVSAVCVASNGRLFVGMMVERTDTGLPPLDAKVRKQLHVHDDD